MNRSSSVLFASSRTLAAVSQADDCLCHVSSHCSARFLSSLASLSYIVRTAKQNCSLSDAMLYRPRSLALLHTAITSCPAVHIPYAFPLNAGEYDDADLRGTISSGPVWSACRDGRDFESAQFALRCLLAEYSIVVVMQGSKLRYIPCIAQVSSETLRASPKATFGTV